MFKTIRNFLILALSLAALSLAGVAAAQDASKLPEPAAPNRATIADGRINVFIGTPRVNGYAIGDSIPVTIVFEMLPVTQDQAPAAAVDSKGERKPKPAPLAMPRVDIAGLKMQVQSADPLDVEMLTSATEIIRYERDGKEYLKVVFYVWQFVTTKQTQVDVKADFMYAVNMLEDGQPDWHKASTPNLSVGIRKTATDNQVTILEGDIKLKASPRVPAAIYMLAGGTLLVMPLFAALAITGWRRYNRPRTLTANELVWLALDPVLAKAEFELDDYKQIFFVLRRRFGVLSLDGHELISTLKKHPDLKSVDPQTVELVFNKEAVFYAKSNKVPPEQLKEFIAGIKALVPRH